MILVNLNVVYLEVFVIMKNVKIKINVDVNPEN